MLSNHSYLNMNRLAMRNSRENEQRLLEELERISSDRSLDAFALDSSPILSTLSLHASHCDALQLDFDQPQSPPPPYADFDTDHATVQVDHSGELSHFPASAWLASSLSSMPPSASVSSTSSTVDRAPAPLNACVAAAAATAAMIVVSDANNSKRPRSPSSPFLAEQSLDTLTQHTMHSESKQSEDPISPRIIQNFGSAESPPTSKCSSPKHAKRLGLAKAALKPPVHNHTSSVNTCSSDTRTVSSILSNAPATDAELSRKRRAEAMERFRRKKAVRCYARRVRYQVRKRIATTRPRVNGRFARRIDAINHAAKAAK